MLVRNAEDTTDDTCPCGGWINHFRRLSGKAGAKCYATGCGETSNIVGAHVIDAEGPGNREYILPLCKAHNKETDEFEVFVSSLDVPARETTKCGTS